MNDTPTDDDTPLAATPANPYWKAVVAASFLFVATTLAITMTQFGDPMSPGNRFLRRHGPLIAAIESGVVLIVGVLAMAKDQKQTRAAKTLSHDTSPISSTDDPPHVG